MGLEARLGFMDADLSRGASLLIWVHGVADGAGDEMAYRGVAPRRVVRPLVLGRLSRCGSNRVAWSWSQIIVGWTRRTRPGERQAAAGKAASPRLRSV
jgi:hypothetical protein